MSFRRHREVRGDLDQPVNKYTNIRISANIRMNTNFCIGLFVSIRIIRNHSYIGMFN